MNLLVSSDVTRETWLLRLGTPNSETLSRNGIVFSVTRRRILHIAFFAKWQDFWRYLKQQTQSQHTQLHDTKSSNEASVPSPFSMNIICLVYFYSLRHPHIAAPLIHHYSDVTMSAMESQMAGVSGVLSTVCSGAHQRKHRGSALLALVRGTHRLPLT